MHRNLRLTEFHFRKKSYKNIENRKTQPLVLVFIPEKELHIIFTWVHLIFFLHQ